MSSTDVDKNPSAGSLCTIEIAKRPRKTRAQLAHGALFLLVFNFGCLMVHAFQLLFVLPLKLVPFAWGRALYERGIRYTKGAFGLLAMLACQVFAPTRLRVTFETKGEGAFTKEDVADIVVRDASGNVIELRLPEKLVIIANHQIYADWWYVWCLMYFMNIHRDVLIVLKKSLKWVPVVGWGMQIFRFIFLERSWALDKLYLVRTLAKLGRKSQEADTPLALIIYPEGTLVSKDTRPVSKRYADKVGIPDMMHTLLPRSTGLHYALRALAPRLPTLRILDITVAYPGIPSMGYGQSYYTLRSIFMDRVPPPIIHMHLRLLDVATAVPIGDLSATDPAKLPSSTSATNGHGLSHKGTQDRNGSMAVEADVPDNERDAFDGWLRALWRAKDEKMAEHLETGVFSSAVPAVEIPLELRRRREVFDAFCCFGPALVGWGWKWVRG